MRSTKVRCDHPVNPDADDIRTTARFYITALEGPWPSKERRKVQKGAPIRLRVQGDGI